MIHFPEYIGTQTKSITEYVRERTCNWWDKRFPKKRKMQVVTKPARMEFLKNAHSMGMYVYFRYPNWDTWVFIDSPNWNPECHYMLTGKRPTVENWHIPTKKK